MKVPFVGHTGQTQSLKRSIPLSEGRKTFHLKRRNFVAATPQHNTDCHPSKYLKLMALEDTRGEVNETVKGPDLNRDRPPRSEIALDVDLYPLELVQTSLEETSTVCGGLRNPGKVCYMNASFQVLFHLTPVVAWMREMVRKGKLADDTYTGKFLRLHKHIKNSPKGDAREFWHPDLGKTIIPGHGQGRMEDAHEWMMGILDELHYDAVFSKTGCLKPDVKKKLGDSEYTSFMHRIFGGKIETEIKCPSEGVHRRIPERFTSLEVAIGKSKSVEEALASYTKEEYLEKDNQYRWEYGEGRHDFKMVNAVKRTRIYEAPTVLILSLKRFRVAGMKRGEHIAYSERLNLRKFMSRNLSDTSRNIWYDLQGVIVHAGHTTSSGHYYSYVKGGDGLWYLFDDEKVERAELNAVFGAEAYVLVYQLDPKSGLPPSPAQMTDEKKSSNSDSKEVKEAEEITKSRKRPFLGGIDWRSSSFSDGEKARKSCKLSDDAHLRDVGSLRSPGSSQRNHEGNDKPLETPSQGTLHSNGSNEMEMETVYFQSPRKERSLEENRDGRREGDRKVSLLSGGWKREEDTDVNPTSWVKDRAASRKVSWDHSQVNEEANVRDNRKRSLSDDYNEDYDRGKVKKVKKRRAYWENGPSFHSAFTKPRGPK